MINFINELIHNSDFQFLDVRSEDEFKDGHFPGAINLPILINEHRKLVGTCYKEKGQQAAIDLGHELVDPLKTEYIKNWIDVLSKNPQSKKYLHCWRGGLRSRISKEWLTSAGFDIEIIEGGYKSLRNHLIETFQCQYNLIVVGGLTGTGKSRLLYKINQDNVIDLEGYANHRGSAFGSFHNVEQSSQQFFENQLALKLYEKQFVYAIEHESRFVGKNIIPPHFFEQINKAPQILLEADLSERIESIYQEYIKNEIQVLSEQSILSLKEKMMKSLAMISKKLGGELYKIISKDIDNAFVDFSNPEKHYLWIEKLLSQYYDKRYLYSQKSHKEQEIIYKGNLIECEEFLQDYINRRGTL
jgi:tRNA 2-selenouridine synthase